MSHGCFDHLTEEEWGMLSIMPYFYNKTMYNKKWVLMYSANQYNDSWIYIWIYLKSNRKMLSLCRNITCFLYNKSGLLFTPFMYSHIYIRYLHRQTVYSEGNSVDVFIVGLPPDSQWEPRRRVPLKAKFVWLEAAAPPVEPEKSSNGTLRNRVGWSDVTSLALVITSCVSIFE